MAANAEKPNGEERPGPSKKPRLAALPTQEALEREDFEVICQFFASGGGDDDNDERVWELLQQHVSRVPLLPSLLTAISLSGLAKAQSLGLIITRLTRVKSMHI